MSMIRPLKPRQTLPLAAVSLGIAFATLTTGMAGIITVTATAGPGLPSLLDSNDSPIPDGNHVEIGYFPANYDFSANSTVTDLKKGWTSFGTLNTQTIFTEPSRFSGDLSDDDSNFAGERVYFFAFLTSDGEAPNQGNYSNVLDYGVFTNNSSSAWTFPDSDSGTPFTMVSTTDATSMSGGIQLTGVPEPSTAGVCGVILGTSILFARRRSPRRRSPGTPSSHRTPTP